MSTATAITVPTNTFVGAAVKTYQNRLQSGSELPNVILPRYNEAGKREGFYTHNRLGDISALFTFPGAYTPVCTGGHAPGIVGVAQQLKEKGVRVIGVLPDKLDVVRSWGNQVDPQGQVEWWADPDHSFGHAAGLPRDMSGDRGQEEGMERAAMVVRKHIGEDGMTRYIVSWIEVEEDAGKCERSSGNSVLNYISAQKI
jgi:glutaredoxin/glutathione-dependent peroxiredoxin